MGQSREVGERWRVTLAQGSDVPAVTYLKRCGSFRRAFLLWFRRVWEFCNAKKICAKKIRLRMGSNHRPCGAPNPGIQLNSPVLTATRNNHYATQAALNCGWDFLKLELQPPAHVPPQVPLLQIFLSAVTSIHHDASSTTD